MGTHERAAMCATGKAYHQRLQVALGNELYLHYSILCNWDPRECQGTFETDTRRKWILWA